MSKEGKIGFLKSVLLASAALGFSAACSPFEAPSGNGNQIVITPGFRYLPNDEEFVPDSWPDPPLEVQIGADLSDLAVIDDISNIEIPKPEARRRIPLAVRISLYAPREVKLVFVKTDFDPSDYKPFRTPFINSLRLQTIQNTGSPNRLNPSQVVPIPFIVNDDRDSGFNWFAENHSRITKEMTAAANAKFGDENYDTFVESLPRPDANVTAVLVLLNEAFAQNNMEHPSVLGREVIFRE